MLNGCQVFRAVASAKEEPERTGIREPKIVLEVIAELVQGTAVTSFGFIENLVVFYLENSGHKITLYTKRWFALANHFFLCYNIFRYFSIFGGFLLTLNQYLL